MRRSYFGWSLLYILTEKVNCKQPKNKQNWTFTSNISSATNVHQKYRKIPSSPNRIIHMVGWQQHNNHIYAQHPKHGNGWMYVRMGTRTQIGSFCKTAIQTPKYVLAWVFMFCVLLRWNFGLTCEYVLTFADTFCAISYFFFFTFVANRMVWCISTIHRSMNELNWWFHLFR